LVIDRRKFVEGMAAGILARPAISDAQQAGRTWQLGILVTGPPPSSDNPYLDALKQGLDEHGYVQGRNLAYVIRAAEGRSDRLPKLAAELVQLNVDAVVTIGSEATRAALAQTHSIPIVFVGPSHPVEEGLVGSLAHPGGNVTGLTSQQSDIVAKTLQFLLDLVPTLSEVAVVWNPTIPSSALLMRDVEDAAVRLRVRIVQVTMAKEDDLAPALATIARVLPGAVLVHSFPVTIGAAPQIAEFAIKHRLPTISTNAGAARRGLLMSYGPNFLDLERRVGGYLDRIFKGAKPADLPVEQPTKFELVVNLKTAKALGLTIPQSLLLRANEVIQ
jgi:putative ABC transport system substrate-binding protein